MYLSHSNALRQVHDHHLSKQRLLRRDPVKPGAKAKQCRHPSLRSSYFPFRHISHPPPQVRESKRARTTHFLLTQQQTTTQRRTKAGIAALCISSSHKARRLFSIAAYLRRAIIAVLHPTHGTRFLQNAFSAVSLESLLFSF
jgi:hypothetical protein